MVLTWERVIPGSLLFLFLSNSRIIYSTPYDNERHLLPLRIKMEQCDEHSTSQLFSRYKESKVLNYRLAWTSQQDPCYPHSLNQLQKGQFWCLGWLATRTECIFCAEVAINSRNYLHRCLCYSWVWYSTRALFLAIFTTGERLIQPFRCCRWNRVSSNLESEESWRTFKSWYQNRVKHWGRRVKASSCWWPNFTIWYPDELSCS